MCCFNKRPFRPINGAIGNANPTFSSPPSFLSASVVVVAGAGAGVGNAAGRVCSSIVAVSALTEKSKMPQRINLQPKKIIKKLDIFLGGLTY